MRRLSSSAFLTILCVAAHAAPVAPIVTEFEPPRESATWLSAGVAYRMRAAEIGAGVGHARNQTRLLVDLRLRSR